MSIWKKLTGLGKDEQPGVESREASPDIVREIARELGKSDTHHAAPTPPAPTTDTESVTFSAQPMFTAVESTLEVDAPEPRVSATGGNIVAPVKATENTTVVDPCLVTRGTLFLDDGDKIAGQHHGKIVSQGAVVFGEESVIHGEVQCESAVISGRFDGELEASRFVVVKETAQVQGRLCTRELEVDPGAVLKGYLDMAGS